ncbi:hypothetical protein FKP32DRAFT_53334 [Trametes sanguinea]|nr:hypothetical protein FKP32DRAFT_53334 [Trametes sanguinea]
MNCVQLNRVSLNCVEEQRWYKRCAGEHSRSKRATQIQIGQRTPLADVFELVYATLTSGVLLIAPMYRLLLRRNNGTSFALRLLYSPALQLRQQLPPKNGLEVPITEKVRVFVRFEDTRRTSHHSKKTVALRLAPRNRRPPTSAFAVTQESH